MSDHVDDEEKKPVKEIPVIFDEGTFTHQTGDRYEGVFEARKKDRSLKMCRQGVYTTAEGDIYSGRWEADKLTDATITYKDGGKYEGPMKDWTYTGRAKYTYPDGTVLNADFAGNCPLKEMALVDPNGHLWLGRAEVGFGWLDPWNHFYQELDKPRKLSDKRV